MPVCLIVSDNSTMTTSAGSERLENIKWSETSRTMQITLTKNINRYINKDFFCVFSLCRLLDPRPESSTLTRKEESALLWR